MFKCNQVDHAEEIDPISTEIPALAVGCIHVRDLRAIPLDAAFYRFAKKFGLHKYINFRVRVEKIKRCNVSGKWHVWTKHNRTAPPHRAYDAIAPENPEVRTHGRSFYLSVQLVYMEFVYSPMISAPSLDVS